MFEQLQFYTKHSINDLRVNGQRTFFALLCIAAGVAAIVSLQTLAAMIGDTLTGNLQENNRGDIQLQIGDFEIAQSNLDRGVEEGLLVEDTVSFFGQSQSAYQLSADGIEAIRDWAEENYPGQIAITYRQTLTNPLQIFFGSGNGTSITDPDTGDSVSQINPLVIDANVYPFYGTVESQDGTPLDELLAGPTDTVVSQKIAEDLNLQVGDTVLLNGAQEPFTVRGIVETAVEVKNPGADFFNSLFGFYYLDLSAIEEFEDVETQTSTVFVQIDDAAPDVVNEVNTRLNEAFPYFEATTTEELRQDYTDLSAAIDDLVTIMGLVSMLIGSIGIINTMQVIVRRRTVEVAVLKTIGLQANQITTLFLVEAVIMGVVGSIAGILLGWASTFVVRGAAEQLVATDLPFQIVPEAALNGFVIGVIVTVVFGFLPTLTAGQVRPGIVLRPSDRVIPRAGILRTLGALALIVVVLTLIANSILSDFTMALGVVVGSFVAVGFLYLWLNIMVWLVGRFLPTFGFVDLKISLRQMLAGRQRAAVTLLALVIGVFSLSVITLFAESISNLLEDALDNAAGGNVAITSTNPQAVSQIEQIVSQQTGVNSYQTIQNYSTEFVTLEKAETGEVVTIDDLSDDLENISFGFGGPPPGEEDEDGFNNTDIFLTQMATIDARNLDQLPTDRTLESGRFLNDGDAGQPVIVVKSTPFTRAAGIEVGDQLTFALVLNGETSEREVTFEVVGLEQTGLVQIGFDSTLRAPASAFPDELAPTTTLVVVDINEENVSDLRREIAVIPGVFILDTNFITQIVEAFLGTFTAFPTMVALLGLVVGGVVIANSVALTTMERRREIAVMKAVGLQRERVLGMILLENGVMGFIGGLIGVGIGLVALVAMISTLGLPASAIPVVSGLLLMFLCILVALVAAVTTAWGASGEKPLNVLRYE